MLLDETSFSLSQEFKKEQSPALQYIKRITGRMPAHKPSQSRRIK